LHPGTEVELALPDAEEKIPAALKIVIYRIIESAFGNIAEHAHAHWIQLALQVENDTVALKISGTTEDSPARQEQRPDLQLRFAEAQERTLLSSGIFSATQDLIGKITLTSSWPIQTPD
jgi:signal transduction histidine kinase